MHNLFTRIKDYLRPSADKILIQACRSGNLRAVRTALKAGANPNTPVYMGEYCYSTIKHEPQYAGTVYVVPLVLAATSALGKDEVPYREIVELLLPKTDLMHVVSGHEKEWYDDQYYLSGDPPDRESEYTLSIKRVLSSCPSFKKVRTEVERADLYPISDDMKSYLSACVCAREHEIRQQGLKQAQQTI